MWVIIISKSHVGRERKHMMYSIFILFYFSDNVSYCSKVWPHNNSPASASQVLELQVWDITAGLLAFLKVSPYVAQTGHKLDILPPQPLKCQLTDMGPHTQLNMIKNKTSVQYQTYLIMTATKTYQQEQQCQYSMAGRDLIRKGQGCYLVIQKELSHSGACMEV